MANNSDVGRRRFLGYAGAASVGGAGVVGGFIAGRTTAPSPPAPEVIRQRYSPFGEHQAGVVTPAPAVHRLIALTLKPGSDKASLGRFMRVWSTDIMALMAGQAVPGDTAGELAQAGVSLSVTVGFGPKVFKIPGLQDQVPDGFIDIPPMRHDRLQAQWSGGDVLAIVSADDKTSVEHAASRLIRDAKPFATLAWVQDGFWRGTDASGAPVTGRNLFGQVDGTANPSGETRDKVVWAHNPPSWFKGGTTLVVRRIEYDMVDWDKQVRERQEAVIGRTLSTGAPLGKEHEQDELDLKAKDADGAFVIPLNAHARRAHPDENGGRQILRRGLNYTHDERKDGEWVMTSGLIFLSFQADIAKQFVPIQRRIDEVDALNEWTHAIGSAVFAIPGGMIPGSWIAHDLLVMPR